MSELTRLINQKLNRLKEQIQDIPTGGGLETLRSRMFKIQQEAYSIELLACQVEKDGNNDSH